MRRRVGVALALALLPGCRQAFGIEDLEPDVDGGDVTTTDGAPASGLRLRHQRLGNSADGTTTITEAAIGDVSVTVNGLAVPVTGDEAPIPNPGEIHRIGVTTPLQSLEYQGLAPGLLLPIDVLDRPSMDPAPTGDIAVKLETHGVGTTQIALYATGEFAMTPLVTSTGSDHVEVALSRFAGLHGAWHALQPTLGDRMHLLVYESVLAAPPYLRVSRAGSDELELDANSPSAHLDSVDQAIVLDGCGSVQSDHALEQMRLVAAGYPTPVASPNWLVVDQPAPALTFGAAPILALATNTENTDSAATFTIGNPIAGHTPLLLVATAGARTLGMASATTSVVVGTFQWNEVSLTCEAPSSVTTLAAGSVGLPGEVVVGGVLVTGNTSLEPTNGDDVVVAWTTDSAPVDRYTVQLYALTGVTALALVPTGPPIYTTDQVVRLPRDRLTVGTTYTIGIVAAHGFRDAARGDLATLSYPFSTATYYSPTFQFL